MWLNGRSKKASGRTFQEVMEQQAARQAGFGEVIPLQRRLPVSQSTETVDSFHYSRSPVIASHPIAFPQPSAPSQHRTARQVNGPVTGGIPPLQHLPAATSSDHSSTSGSTSGSASSYHAGTASTSGTIPSSSSSAGSVRTYPLSPTSSAQYPWSDCDWGHPDHPSHAGSVLEVEKKRGGLKGWLKKRAEKERAKGFDEPNEGVVKEDKPVFVGGGRGGMQQRRKPTPAGLKKPSPLVSISESTDPDDSLPPHPSSSHSSTTPLVTFTPDIQEALEVLTPAPKPVFIGGGRGGMQNRKTKDSAKSSSASGSGKSSTSDGDSSRRSLRSFTSSMVDGSVVSGGSAGKPNFVGGGRGGVQNRKPGGLAKKKSEAVLGGKELMAGIGVTSYTVTTSERAGADSVGSTASVSRG